jgi:hypothetical protein
MMHELLVAFVLSLVKIAGVLLGGKMKLLLLLTLLVSCGKIKHEIKAPKSIKVEAPEEIKVDVPEEIKVDAPEIPENITVGPDFEKAALFCDNRYGVLTDAAEECFYDYRNYYKVNVKLDINSIIEFCEQSYGEGEEATEACIEDLITLFNQYTSGGTPGQGK